MKRAAVDIIRYFIDGVDLASAASTAILPAQAGRKFLPLGAMVHITGLTGVLVVGPSIRIGNDGGHANVAPIVAVANTVVADSAVSIPLVATLNAIDIGSTAISMEVSTVASGTGGLTLTGAVHLWGILL